ncbi:hypothetical protein K488DRAFT_40474 [Vararia minispora EC-137]|uniref:Uncharacterized protein n=1 Tax=Vararia minispora EC-137 TaxID=1314806 RepID=A0ACB8QYT3_9AGAM|nr:hypothetical protein K488DRAFT_40474 [Vararia minispora EC-137]
MAAFSRLQLAAALIEYDNDISNPDAPFRSAQESAIFSHMRQADTAVRTAARRSTDYLGVNLPSDTGGSQSPRNSHVRAQSSLSGLMTNPFGGAEDDMEGRDGSYGATPEPEMEVDLASWGLDSFVPKEKVKVKKKDKGKSREVELPNPHEHARAKSVDLNHFGGGDAFLDSTATSPPAGSRRRSASSAMELGRSMSPRELVSQRPQSAHALIDSIPATPPLHSVPFPTQSIRSPSPGSMLENPGPARVHGRTYSTTSFGSRTMLNDVQEEGEPNPFALDPPSPGRQSRFDPKAARSRTASIGSMGSRALLDDFPDDKENMFAVRPPSPSRSSRFDPKARSRVMSTASMGSRMMLDDGASVMIGATYHRERPMSTMEMLRPKVLVMPSPLQGTEETSHAPPSHTVRDGFQLTLSADGTPLPPGARASRSSTNLISTIQPPASGVPNPSNSFIPNPRSSLSLSQLIFRNQLMVDGQRDVAYADLDRGLERATEDGQQVMAAPEEEEPAQPVTVVVDEFSSRPAGKLFGKSLVDELEERKATMRNKQRVFYGDARPSMMSRPTNKRSNTLIDPTTLSQRPGSQLMDTSLARRNSYGPKPLLDLNEDGELPIPRRPGQMPSTRSVFGVDTLWEKEMAKLQQIEAQEAELRKVDEERKQAALAKESKRKKRKSKGKELDVKPLQDSIPSPASSPSAEQPTRVSLTAPVLPDIPQNITRGPPPPPGADESDSDSDSSDASAGKATTPRWFAGASDDGHEDGPVRKPGVGPRYPHGRPREQPLKQLQDDDDSEEDVPLVATVDRALQRATRANLQTALAPDDSDEDKPLSRVLQKKQSTVGQLDINFDNLLSSANPSASGVPKSGDGGGDSDDEDEMPLGLRASRVIPSSTAHDSDEDEKPLGLHPQQQMRSQYQMSMMAQQQQQQAVAVAAVQQMALQQQMTASMMFSNPSLMGSGFFAPTPMAVPMPMMPPPVAGSPPPPRDPAKFNRVDQWRRGVPVDG